MNADLYKLVTDQIIAALERGVIPWRKPWHETSLPPANALSKRPYRGVNTFLLGLASYRDHRWLTFKQAQALGGSVRAGEKSCVVVFWKRWEPPVEDSGSEAGPRRAVPLLRYYRLFNAVQCDGLNLPPIPGSEPGRFLERIERAEGLITQMPDPPKIIENCDGAWYRRSDDVIGMPNLGAFKTADQYYATLCHELGHATGHARRLNRPGIFQWSDYSREELVAELTSAYCCASVGIDNGVIEDAAAYIDVWLQKLRSDPKAMVIAAAQAQKAADYIRGISPVEETVA